ncbi:hypothetical protein GCM10007103_16330 [Salinimicrobium marinum]|uniref:TIGR00341 family protein n=1 Tax=Salinimicrobium marinum TaxID=680283 RepID=A0A918SEV5_9FLAO|nr:DUF389 domain-containing protein [Salinimicrobium marinum]GHA35479.1 hypothetical protein GCM10007103_16330 [Salinimicrobium marinum]
MLYILHQQEEKDAVEKKIVPLLKDKNYELISYPSDNLEFSEEDTIITYLGDSHLRNLLPLAGKKKWCIGVLPHPEVVYTIRGLGISNNLEEAIEEIVHTQERETIDLLYCNGNPVFQSVNIGDVFILTEGEDKAGFAAEVWRFLKNIKRFTGLSHRSFKIKTDEEKIVRTSALGMIVVEHPHNSVVSKRLVTGSAVNDGMFHVLILSPQNILELLWFFLRSLLPISNTMQQLPKFIGSIKTSNLQILPEQEIEFTIDGVKTKSSEINLEVHYEALVLQQSSIYNAEKGKASEKKSVKLNHLPKGEKQNELIRRKLPWMPRATTEEFQDLFKVLRENAKLSAAFMIMMILSTLIATFGLFSDSSPVIIGAMILAPIISPIVSFSMGMVRYEIGMLKKGIITIMAGTIVCLLFSAGVTLLVPLQVLTSEISARLSPNLLDLGIAIASGIAAAYAHADEEIARSLAGVAIAVALVPPLAVAGIGIGWWDWEVFSGAFLLYLTNLAGIILFAGITFLFLGFAPFKRAKMGLIYTTIIILFVTVPLSLTFNRVQEESSITRELEGASFEDYILRDVKVRYGDPFRISVKAVGPKNIEPEQLERIKSEIEERIGYSIILEVVSALEY